MDLIPNNSPFASEPWNNPQLGAMLRPDSFGAVPFSEVDETAAIGNLATGDLFTPLGPENAMMSLRHQFPYLPVIPFTNEVETIALAQNTPSEFVIPSASIVCLFQGQGNYYVSTQGNAAVPVVGGGPTRSIFKPERFLFYVRGLRSMSVVTPDASAVVTAMFFIPREYPVL